jgi:hypothetical protein
MVKCLEPIKSFIGVLPREGTHWLFNATALVLFLTSMATMAVAQNGNLPVFTSPIDVSSYHVQFHAVAPDRNTGQMLDVPIPVGLLGPKMNQVVSSPLGTQMDQYWAVTPDPKTGLTPKAEACNEIISQIQVQVKSGSSISAYDVACNLASTGKLLLQQEGSTLILAYLLTNNNIGFNITTPATCHAGHGTPVCPNDPRITATFATEIVTTVRAVGVCQLLGEGGTVITQSVTIDGNHNLAGAVATLADNLFLGHQIHVVERAIEGTEKPVPLPLDAAFKELRDSDGCTGKNVLISQTLKEFSGFETTVDARPGIVFHMIHPVMGVPVVQVPDAGAAPQPTFTRPMIATNRPTVQVGTPLGVNGRFFPLGLNSITTMLPVTINHGGSCFGGGTDLQWGLPSGPMHNQHLQGTGTAQAVCANLFEATPLTPTTAYQFRARDCDSVTCSLWSKPARGVTAKVNTDGGKVVLSLDGVTTLGTGTITPQGTFDTSVIVPANVAPGPHKIRAVNSTALAETALGVTGAAAGGSKASLMMVGVLTGELGCPNHQINSTQTDANFMLFGTGFQAGVVNVRLDTAAGLAVGNATAQADGSFCQRMIGVPGNQAGNHKLVALQNGAIQAQFPITFVVAMGPH